jgi:long-chain acyl-CoA synthetase
MNLLDYFGEKTKKYAPYPFLFYYDQEISYGEFAKRVYKMANGLARLGIRQGDFVHVLVENSPETLISYFAIQHLGAIAGPINGWWKAEEVRYLLNDSKGRALIIGPQYLEILDAIRADCPSLQLVIEVGGATRPGHVTYESLLEGSPADPPAAKVGDLDPAYIFYTSGTTGDPKGVLLSHRNVVTDIDGFQDLIDLPEYRRIMIFLPLFHVNAMITSVSSLWKGHAVVLRRKFSASEFWQNVEKYKVNFFSAVPAVYNILLKDPDRARYDTSSLDFGICGAAPLSVETLTEFQRVFNLPIIEGYGLTEVTCVSTLNPRVGERKVGSIGLPLKGQEIKIVDEENRELPVGQAGEIVIRGEPVMIGYYNRPQATAETIDQLGFLHTGDVGYKDKDGYIFIVDRIKEMVIRGGENIYPKEIDNVLASHPKISDAACVGVPDKAMGEEVKAFVILREGETATEEEIRDYCKKRLADFKVPRYIEFLNQDFPRNPIGKILKKVLKKWAVEGAPKVATPPVEVADIFASMPQRFQPEAAAGFAGRIAYNITGPEGGQWTLTIADQAMKLVSGLGESDVKVTVAARDWVAITLGTLDAMTAFSAGKIKAEGNVGLLLGVTKIFKPYQAK